MSTLIRRAATPAELAAVNTAIRADLASVTADPAKGGGMSGFADATPYPVATLGGQVGILKMRELQIIDRVPRSEWDAIANGTSTYDLGPLIKAAWAEKPGRPVVLPSGRVRINTLADYVSSSAAVFSEAPKIYGPGSDICEVDSRVANGPAFSFDTNAVGVGRFIRNLELCGFSLSGEWGNPVNGSGISLRHAYNVLCSDLYVRNLARDGLYVMLNEGDSDGCNNVILERSRFFQCARWGLNNDSQGGHNEFSFLNVKDGTSFTACGTASAWDPSTGAAPTSGSLRWKGNGAKLVDGYVTESYGPAVFIEGGAGLAVQFAARDFTFENCGRSATAAAFYCSGLGGLDLDNIDLRNNDTLKARYGFFFETTTYPVLGARIRGTKVQVTTGNNPHTMFEARGGNGVDLKVSETTWRVYGGAGQTRFGDGLLTTFKSSLSLEDDNRMKYAAGVLLEATLNTASPVYTADFARYEQHVVTLGAAMTGTVDFAAPNYGGLTVAARAGREMVLTIINNTAAPKNISFSTISTRNPPASLAAGAATTGRFVYVAGVGLVQNGPWG